MIADVLMFWREIVFSSLALEFFVDFRHPVREFGATQQVNRNYKNKIKNGFQQEKQGETDEIT